MGIPTQVVSSVSKAVARSLFRLYKFTSKIFFFIAHECPSELRIPSEKLVPNSREARSSAGCRPGNLSIVADDSEMSLIRFEKSCPLG